MLGENREINCFKKPSPLKTLLLLEILTLPEIIKLNLDFRKKMVLHDQGSEILTLIMPTKNVNYSVVSLKA